MLGRVGQESTHGEVEHQLTHAEVLADENMVKQHGLKVASSQLQVIPDALRRDYRPAKTVLHPLSKLLVPARDTQRKCYES